MNLISAVEGLSRIVDRYPASYDPVSIGLHVWAGDLFAEADSLRSAPPREQMSAAIRQINKLFSEVVTANLAPHPFAEEVISWGQSVRNQLPGSSLVARGHRELRFKMDEALDEILGALAVQEIAGERLQLELRARLQEREENLSLELAEIRQETDERLQVLERELTARKVQHLQNIAASEARLVEKKRAAAHAFVQLQGNLNAAEAASSAKIHAAEQEIRRVIQVQEQTGAQLSNALIQNQATASEVAKGLNDTATLQNAALALEASLQAEDEEIKRLAAEIELINKGRAEMQPMIAHARNKKKKLQNRPCVVM